MSLRIKYGLTNSSKKVFFALFFLFLSSKANALECHCKVSNIDNDIEQSDVIFVGQLLSSEESIRKSGYIEKVFQLRTGYKGLDGLPIKRVKIYIKNDKCLKLIKLKTGGEYLIYAKGSPAFLTSNHCLPNDYLESSTKVIKKLKKN